MYQTIGKTVLFILVSIVLCLILGFGGCAVTKVQSNKTIELYKDTISMYEENIFKLTTDIVQYNIEVENYKDTVSNLRCQMDSIIIELDSVNEELILAKIKLERIKEYNRIAAQGNNIKFLRGWINRVFND
jgi:hypothetical protein